MSVDEKSYELAEHFLQDTTYEGDEKQTHRLADVIQDSIETWMKFNSVE